MFNERKTAQMAGFFLNKEGGSMAVLKLMKLLYLADRGSMRLYDAPISGDRMVAMPHGPVLSRTLELTNGECSSSNGGWSHWIAGRAKYEVGLARRTRLNRESFQALSDADLDILEDTWREFGGMTKYQIRDYTHEHCGEWTNPNGSSREIPYRDVFLALGRDIASANQADARLVEDNVVARLFASIPYDPNSTASTSDDDDPLTEEHRAATA
jgi:uncharacterized phage-associated protein